MHKRRLLWQIYPAFLLITLISVGGVAWYASASLRKFYIAHTADDLQARAWLAEERIGPLLAARDFAQIDALCKTLGKKADTRLTVVLPDGKVIGDSWESPQRMENHADRPEIIDALDGRPGVSLRYSQTIKETLRYAAVPIRRGDQTIGAIRAAIPLSAIDRALYATGVHIAVWSLLAAALLMIASLALSRRIARPLALLNQGAERFARGDLSYRVSIADSLELGALAETLNQMATQLDEKMRHVVRQRNEREAILSGMVEGVLAIDSEQRVIRINKAAAKLVGIDPSRAEGRTLPEIIRNTALQRLVDDVFASQEPAEAEIALRGVQDRTLHVHGTVLRDAREGELGVLLVLHDVTTLKNLERIRRDFVANVSHELRTPVTAIKGFVETLLDGAMDDPEQLQRFLRIVDQQTNRLNAIFEDLLTLSRIEQGAEKAGIALVESPIRPVLEAAVETCRSKAGEKGLRIEVSCADGLLAPINPPLLEQAVVNLVDNAIKYSEAGQSVAIEAVGGDNEVVICVRDRGCGIPSAHIERIFERFYRVDPARSRKLGGTGLGLAIVKHIAQLHGGRATVESAVGQGSEFFLHIPLAPKESDGESGGRP